MRTKRRKLSSKQLFDHLQEELAMKRCSPQVQRAMRKWAAREYLYPVEPLLTAEEQRLVEKHGAFQHHIKQEMDNLLEDEVKLICVEIAYEKQFFSYEADSILPWFLRRSKSELEENCRRHETLMSHRSMSRKDCRG